MVEWKDEWKTLLLLSTVFLVVYFLPAGNERFDNAVMEALHLVKWYAREHVLLCLIPAFFIAGAIGVFVSQESVIKYLGPGASRILAYAVASVSGTILAVCSCTVLPLFAGIYRMGAGLGPACTFLYSGPAINVLAIILTARILGLDIGIARAILAIVFSIAVGLLMHIIFRKEELERIDSMIIRGEVAAKRSLLQNILFFSTLVGILVFANFSKGDSTGGFFYVIFSYKWFLTSIFAVALAVILVFRFAINRIHIALASIIVISLAFIFPARPEVPFFAGVIALSYITGRDRGEAGEWFDCSWTFAKQILPLLFGGVLVAGFLLGRVGHEGIIPSAWVTSLVGGNSFIANLFASIFGAFMYFATLTEVPIVQGLLGSGMGKGPALALLLAGPALSLPNMLVMRSIMGTKKTIVFCSIIIGFSTIAGMIFGSIAV